MEKRTSKAEIVKNYLSNEENLKAISKELDLLLDNNYGEKIQYSYSLINYDKKELNEYYRKITKDEVKQLKYKIIESVLFTVENFIRWDRDINISVGTIKKAMKEINFYNTFNDNFINNLNGESENIEIFKKYF